MKTQIQFIKTTLIGGGLVILPLAVLAMLIRQGAETIRPFIQPVLAWLPADTLFPRLLAIGLETLTVVLGCFVVGLVFRTGLGKRITRWLEAKVFQHLPGYPLLRSLTRGILGEEETLQFKVALVDMEGGLVPAFIIEAHADGRYTVFVPSSPTPTSGAIYIFPNAVVHLVDVPFPQAVRCITGYGQGAEALVRAMRQS